MPERTRLRARPPARRARSRPRIPVVLSRFPGARPICARRRFARLCDRLSMPWREEIALIEDHPALLVGFALSTAAVLAMPVLNLAFRPIVIIAACHVLGQLEAAPARSIRT